MTPETVDFTGLIANFPLAAVVIYLFREVQRLHSERLKFMSDQLEIFQKLALEVKKQGGNGA